MVLLEKFDTIVNGVEAILNNLADEKSWDDALSVLLSQDTFEQEIHPSAEYILEYLGKSEK